MRNTGNDRTRFSRTTQSLRMNERTSSVVICEPTPVTMESSFREVGRMWQLHSDNFVVSRSFLRSTCSFVDGVVVNEKKRKYDYKTSQFNGSKMFFFK